MVYRPCVKRKRTYRQCTRKKHVREISQFEKRSCHVSSIDPVSSEFDAQRSWHEQQICNDVFTGHWAKDCDVSFDAYYKRTGKPDKQKIFLDVKYRDKDFAKAHGARWDPNARKWFCWDRVPDALKEFEPIRKHAYIKPEKTIDGLCKYCFFSFEEGLRRSDSDASACVHCAPKKQPPTCKHCNRYMVSDC